MEWAALCAQATAANVPCCWTAAAVVGGKTLALLASFAGALHHDSRTYGATSTHVHVHAHVVALSMHTNTRATQQQPRDDAPTYAQPRGWCRCNGAPPPALTPATHHSATATPPRLAFEFFVLLWRAHPAVLIGPRALDLESLDTCSPTQPGQGVASGRGNTVSSCTRCVRYALHQRCCASMHARTASQVVRVFQPVHGAFQPLLPMTACLSPTPCHQVVAARLEADLRGQAQGGGGGGGRQVAGRVGSAPGLGARPPAHTHAHTRAHTRACARVQTHTPPALSIVATCRPLRCVLWPPQHCPLAMPLHTPPSNRSAYVPRVRTSRAAAAAHPPCTCGNMRPAVTTGFALWPLQPLYLF